jgi:hypothetical protein
VQNTGSLRQVSRAGVKVEVRTKVKKADQTSMVECRYGGGGENGRRGADLLNIAREFLG